MAEGLTGAVNVNLVPPELIRPKLRRMLMLSIGIGVVMGLFFGLLAGWWVGVIAAVLLGGPFILISVAGMRRDQSIDGTVITSRSLATRTVDLAREPHATITVHKGGGGQAMLKAGGVTVTLAVYAPDGRGRELPVEALAGLEKGLRAADARSRHEAIDQPAGTGGAADGAEDQPAGLTELADVLRAQLQSEARGAGLQDRALYRATRMGQEGVRAGTALTSAQVRRVLVPGETPVDGESGPGGDGRPDGGRHGEGKHGEDENSEDGGSQDPDRDGPGR